ncbi:MAG TPA: calcium-binding protein, partial [Beijerinckiaceae bacterium]|nr:calcium-binding protein [Beijerinckiaceae bacterium]
GLGRDQMVGSAGADVFDFNALADSVVGANRDVVYFEHAEGDKIDVSNIDANAAVGGNQAFAFIGGAGFSGAAGQLRFSGGVLQGDVNGDGNADFEVRIVGTLIAGDVIL